MSAPEFNHAITLQFLDLLDPDHAETRSECWSAIPEREGENIYPKQVHASFADIHQRLPELGEMGYGLFMCINEIEPRSETRRSKFGKPYEADVRYVSQIKRVRAVFGDFDDPSQPLPEFPIEPSIIVQSSPNKWHVYWLVDPDDPLPVSEFDVVQKSIIGAYRLNGADKSMLSPNHIMRLPGSLHRKEEPRPVQIIEATGVRYGASTLRTAFRPPATTPPGYDPEAAARSRERSRAMDRMEELQPTLNFIHNLFGPPRPDGAYNVTCPWGDQHTTPRESKSSAVYWPPSDGNKYAGGFDCKHSHCAHRNVSDFYGVMRSMMMTAMVRGGS